MQIKLPSRRDPALSKKNISQITRRTTRQQPGAKDPGVAGGPSTIPSFADAGAGVAEAGNMISGFGTNLSSQLQQDQDRTDVLGTRVELNKLKNRLSGLTSNYDPIAGTFRDPDTAVIHSNGLEAYNKAFETKYKDFYTELQQNPSYSPRMIAEFPKQAELIKGDVKGGFSTVVGNAQTSYYKRDLESALAFDLAENTGYSTSDRVKRNHNIANSLNNFSEVGDTPNIYSRVLSYSDRLEIEAKANGNIFKKDIEKFVRSRQFSKAKDYLERLPGTLRNNGVTSVAGASAEGVRLARKYLMDEMDKDANRLRQEAKDSKPQIEKIEKTVDGKVILQFFDLNDIQYNSETKQAEPLLEVDKGEVEGKPNFIYTNPNTGQTFIISNSGENVKEVKTGQSKIEEYKEEYAVLKKIMPEASEQEIRRVMLEKRYPGEKKSELDKKLDYIEEFAPDGTSQEDIRIYKMNIINEPSDFAERLAKLQLMKDRDLIDEDELKSRTLDLINTTEPPDLKRTADLQWLKENKSKYTEEQYNAAIFRTRMGFDLPEGLKNPTTGFIKLIKEVTNERIGGVMSDGLNGTYSVPEGLSSLSLKIQSEVLNALQTGIYSNGKPVLNTGDIPAILETIVNFSAYKDKFPVRLNLKDRFDKAIHATYNNDAPAGKKLTILATTEPYPEDINGKITLIMEETAQLLSEERRKAMRPDIEAELAERGLRIDRATGIVSGLQDFVGQLSQFGGRSWARKDVTNARLVFSLIARDYIRFVSLSPRFAVKEQELLRRIFPGPELLNSPTQASYRLDEFKKTLLNKIISLRETATAEEIDRSERMEARREAEVWANTVRNIDRYKIKRPATGTLKDIAKLNKQQTTDYLLTHDTDELVDRAVREMGKKKGEKFIADIYDKYLEPPAKTKN